MTTILVMICGFPTRAESPGGTHAQEVNREEIEEIYGSIIAEFIKENELGPGGVEASAWLARGQLPEGGRSGPAVPQSQE